jgi:hypothetical protein
MPIKYAEVIIRRDLEKETIFSYVKRKFGNENEVTDNDTIIISFDNDNICDVKQEYVDKKYEFGFNLSHTKFPYYFEMPDKNNLFSLKLPHIDAATGDRKMDFKNIFKNYTKMQRATKVPSVNNTIYTCGDKEVFSIVKHSSNDANPIYFMAYDDELFERSDLVYLVVYIFK